MTNDWSFADKEFARNVLHVVLEDEPIAMPVVTEKFEFAPGDPLAAAKGVFAALMFMGCATIATTALYLLASWIFP